MRDDTKNGFVADLERAFCRFEDITMATRGARSLNLQVLLRMRRMYVASIRLDFHYGT